MALAILVEVAFINNPNQQKLLKDDTFLDKASVGIVKGLLEYIGVTYTDNVVKMKYKGKLLLVEGIFQGDKNYVGIRDLLEQMDFVVDWEQSTGTVMVK